MGGGSAHVARSAGGFAAGHLSPDVVCGFARLRRAGSQWLATGRSKSTGTQRSLRAACCRLPTPLRRPVLRDSGVALLVRPRPPGSRPGRHDTGMPTARTLWTIGHSTREWDVFTGMLREAGVEALADVRRYPGSRRNPQFSAEAMAAALPEAGI